MWLNSFWRLKEFQIYGYNDCIDGEWWRGTHNCTRLLFIFRKNCKTWCAFKSRNYLAQYAFGYLWWFSTYYCTEFRIAMPWSFVIHWHRYYSLPKKLCLDTKCKLYKVYTPWVVSSVFQARLSTYSLDVFTKECFFSSVSIFALIFFSC